MEIILLNKVLNIDLIVKILKIIVILHDIHVEIGA